MKLYIVRHGKTEFNDKALIQGWSDGPLLEESIEQAFELGEKIKARDLGITKLYSSDSFRTLHTSMKILDGMDSDLHIHHMGELREYFFGEGELMKIKDLWEDVAEIAGYDSVAKMEEKESMLERVDHLHTSQKYRRAESVKEFKERVVSGIHRIIEESDRDDKILVVCHGMTIFQILEYFGYDVTENTSFANLSVSEIDVGNRKIISAGEVY